ncbi:MAG: hypothetical protein J6112_03340 [Clostridia bacterium]|nr:hypothetical protein [Clostridia bacterium]
MKVRRIVIISLLAALAAVIAVSLIYAVAAVNAAKETCGKYMAIRSKSVLPPEYCFENENLTIDDQTLNELIGSLCAEAAAFTTDTGLERYKSTVTRMLRQQADKEYTVSRREIEVKEWTRFKFVAIDEIEITLAVEERVTLYRPIDGVISRDPYDTTVSDYTFTVRNVAGSWRIT